MKLKYKITIGRDELLSMLSEKDPTIPPSAIVVGHYDGGAHKEEIYGESGAITVEWTVETSQRPVHMPKEQP